ncbi:2-oxoglutarate (2OG) and Fe(II)-dependent oxygenase superfamily protein [Forsythia ovata]|uniref:2-oxoglutarate-dependent dioxygenase DAO n=1 Tax=Forsythia ovata TaxID=205694 RepID=A0ABD1R3U2_9LAMI
MADTPASNGFPVIDMLHFPAQLPELIKACEENGCFRIVNFDSILPVSLLYEMKAVVTELFELPLEIKQRNVDVIVGSGYKKPGEINSIHEGLGLYDIASSRSVDEFCNQLDATPQQRETIERYAKAVHDLITDIGHKIGEGLGLESVPFEAWPCQFRINKYPFTHDAIGSAGLKTHTDNGFLTIVQDDEILSGLEVMEKSGKFVAVDPCPGALLVTLGDIAVAWSNGRFYNVKHQVVCKEAGIRMSIATFLLGPRETMVEAPPELVDSEHPRLFVPFKFEDFRKTRFFKHSHAGEALDLFRVES